MTTDIKSFSQALPVLKMHDLEPQPAGNKLWTVGAQTLDKGGVIRLARDLAAKNAPPADADQFWQALSYGHPTAHLWRPVADGKYRSACGIVSRKPPFGSRDAGHCSRCAAAPSQAIEPMPAPDALTTLSPAEQDDLERCEAVIARGVQTFIEVGEALAEVREKRLYRAACPTFEDYCREKWGIGSSRARQLIGAAAIVGTIESVTTVTPTNEAQLRPLAGLPPDQQQAAWQQAVEQAGGQPTARHVEQAARAGREPHSMEQAFPLRLRKRAQALGVQIGGSFDITHQQAAIWFPGESGSRWATVEELAAWCEATEQQQAAARQSEAAPLPRLCDGCGGHWGAPGSMVTSEGKLCQDCAAKRLASGEPFEEAPASAPTDAPAPECEYCTRPATSKRKIGGVLARRCDPCAALAEAMEALIPLCDRAEKLGATINYVEQGDDGTIPVRPPPGYQQTWLRCNAEDLTRLVESWERGAQKTTEERSDWWNVGREWRRIEQAINAGKRGEACAAALLLADALAPTALHDLADQIDDATYEAHRAAQRDWDAGLATDGTMLMLCAALRVAWQRAERAEASAAALRQEVERLLSRSAGEHDEVKALIIQIRKYAIGHDLAIGECVAWDRLKKKFGAGQSSNEADWAWLARYETRKGTTP